MIMKLANCALDAERSARHQSQDGWQVAEASNGRGSQGQAVRTALTGSDQNRISGDCRFPASHAAVSGRLSLRPAAIHPAADTVRAASRACRISRVPLVYFQCAAVQWAGRRRQEFRQCPIWLVHSDMAEEQTAGGILYLFAGIICSLASTPQASLP